MRISFEFRSWSTPLSQPCFSSFVIKIGSFFAVLLLSACASSGLFTENSDSARTLDQTPISERIGDGGTVIGLLVAGEPGNLSDGAVSSAYLSAKLAVQTLKNAQVSLIVRRYEPSQSALQSAASAFSQAGVKIIIGPADNSDAATLAALMAGQNVPIISLATGADASQKIYGAGLSRDREAIAVVGEMTRRGYRSVIIARTGAIASTRFAATLLTKVKNAGITATELDISNSQDGLANLKALGASQDAIIFATGPQYATGFTDLLKIDAQFAKLAIVGNSGWGTNPTSIPTARPLWYASLAGSHLAEYRNKFLAVSDLAPTLLGATVYDLVVMAAILPTVVSNDPYAGDVLSNSQGFTGQTGAFKFDANGKVTRAYAIVSIDQ